MNRQIEITPQEFTDPQKVHQRLNAELFNIEYYGNNLDALHDVIRLDVTRPFAIVLTDVSETAGIVAPNEINQRHFASFVEILVGDCTEIEKQNNKVVFYFK